MSLAQVARGKLSRTAVHLAETGRTRPTLSTLEVIAERTGKPLDFFLAAVESGPGGPSSFLRLRALVAAGEFVELGASAEKVVATTGDPLEKAWARMYLAKALIQQGRPEDALIEIRQAVPMFEARNDVWSRVDCLELEATALQQVEDPAALEVAQQALEMCRQSQPADPLIEARVLSRLGAIHFARHDWRAAITSYTSATELAGALRDIRQLAKTYTNLGGAYQELGDWPRAAYYAHKAIVVNELLEDQLALARAENNLGIVLMRQGDLEGAEEHMERALALCNELAVEVGRGHVLLSLAELHLARGESDTLVEDLQATLTLLAGTGERASSAQGHELLAQVYEARGEPANADQEFRAAIRILEEGSRTQRLIDCLATYAGVLEARGDKGGALEQMKLIVGLTRPELVPRAEATGSAASGTAGRKAG